MKKRYLIVFLFVLLFATACGTVGEPATVVVPTETMQGSLPSVETANPNCLGDEISLVGQSIADDYDSASYEQVMTWFCSGAEFEDILVALETQTQTDTSAGEMLQMLADGFTWDEIWLVTGLVD